MATTKLTCNLINENPDHLALVRIITPTEKLTNDYVYPTIKQGQIRKARFYKAFTHVRIGLTQKELVLRDAHVPYNDLVYHTDVEFISWL
jgi:hypothetical protein